MKRICLHSLSFCPCMRFSSLFYVSILLIIHECPLSLPIPLPFSSPVAIIESTTSSAVSSPGQYMSLRCTPNQPRGLLPHTNLIRNLLHLDLFQLAGCNACWVYSFIVCFLFLYFWLIFGWLVQPAYIYYLQPVSSPHPTPVPFIKAHLRRLYVERITTSSKWLLHMPLGLTLFMLMASSCWFSHH